MRAVLAGWLKLSLPATDNPSMADVPCYKGSVIASLVRELNKHFDCGEITRAEAERYLEPQDFDLLEGVVMPSQLYPLESYARMCELQLQTIGNGSIDFLKEKGRQTAIALIDGMGLYAQLNHADNAEVARKADATERYEAFGRDLELMNTIMGSIGNFGAMKTYADPDHPGRRWVSEQQTPAEYTDALVWRAAGFRNEMARRHGHDNLWSWTRQPGVIVWKMTRDL